MKKVSTTRSVSKEVRTLKDPYDEEDENDVGANWRSLGRGLDSKILFKEYKDLLSLVILLNYVTIPQKTKVISSVVILIFHNARRSEIGRFLSCD